MSPLLLIWEAVRQLNIKSLCDEAIGWPSETGLMYL